MKVYTVVDTRPNRPQGNAVETFLRREDAERFVDEMRGDDPGRAGYLRIEERERNTGIVNRPVSRRTGGLIGVVVLSAVLALLAWWWSTVELVDGIGLF